jgi:hypothetical protein
MALAGNTSSALSQSQTPSLKLMFQSEATDQEKVKDAIGTSAIWDQST